MNCNCCFTDFIAKCNTSLQVYAQLVPLSDYTWVIADKHGNQYEGDFTTDSDGFWEIPVDQLPSGLLTQYSGEFTLQVQDSGCKPVKYKIAQEYDCINFTVRAGTRVKDNLGCSFDSVASGGSGNSAYKVYTAFIGQTSSTSEPTVQVLENTLGSEVTWTRLGTGIYSAITDIGAVPFYSSVILPFGRADGTAWSLIPIGSTSISGYYNIYNNGDVDNNNFILYTVNFSFAAVDIWDLMELSKIFVEVRVYP